MFIINPDSNQDHTARQRCASSAVRQAGMCLLIVLALASTGIGCQGTYRQTPATYPADPCARLGLRIMEAQRAEKEAEQAAIRLRDRLAKGLAGEGLEPDVDRLELATLEFRRRMATVHDAAASCNEGTQFAAEIERLRTHSSQMHEMLKLIRGDAAALSSKRLDEFLRKTFPR